MIWESREDLEAWTQSDLFRKAHAQASAPNSTWLGHPEAETFEAVVRPFLRESRAAAMTPPREN